MEIAVIVLLCVATGLVSAYAISDFIQDIKVKISLNKIFRRRKLSKKELREEKKARKRFEMEMQEMKEAEERKKAEEKEKLKLKNRKREQRIREKYNAINSPLTIEELSNKIKELKKKEKEQAIEEKHHTENTLPTNKEQSNITYIANKTSDKTEDREKE